MQKTRAEVTVDFDHHRPARVLNPDLAYAELRHSCPVAWSEAHGGFWLVTEHKDVERVTRTHQLFSTREGITLPTPPYGQSALIDFDPPKHTAYRRAMNPVLSREAVQMQLKPRIAHWTDVFIDRIIEAGHCDLVYDIAVAIPTAVTMEWLGWSNQDDWWKFGKAWHDLMGRPLGDPGFIHASEVIAGFDTSIAEELADRRSKPRGDALSHVANLEIEGERIAENDAISLVRLLVGAGVDTTTSLIGSALVHLHFYPDDRRRLSEKPELWATATEEFLRRYSPIRTVMRTCVQETELGECPVKPGEHVLAGISSANLDANAFPEPLRFDLERTPNRHVSFGTGVHMCLGMHLARAEFEIVLRRVLERIPDYRIAEDELIEYSRQSSVSGWMTAPANFTPGRKILPENQAVAGFNLAY
jgi:cytochrome P450